MRRKPNVVYARNGNGVVDCFEIELRAPYLSVGKLCRREIVGVLVSMRQVAVALEPGRVTLLSSPRSRR